MSETREKEIITLTEEQEDLRDKILNIDCRLSELRGVNTVFPLYLRALLEKTWIDYEVISHKIYTLINQRITDIDIELANLSMK